MTRPLPVFAGPGVRDRHQTDAILTSLPLSYAAAPAETVGGVVVVDGPGDWPQAASQALRAGAAGVIVVEPEARPLAELRRTAADHGLVVVDSPWAANPVLEAAAAAFRATATAGPRLECRITVGVGGALPRTLLGQLGLVRALLGPVTQLRVQHRSEHGYVGEARSGGTAVDLSVVCTDAVPAQARARLLTGDGSVDLTIPSGETAQPARLTVTGPQGAVLAPTRYESGHRATWRRMHALLASGGSAPDLADLEADIRTAAVFSNLEG